MTKHPTPLDDFDNPHKRRKGMSRLWHATSHSIAGLSSGLGEAAFRLELALALPLLPAAFWLGRTWSETVILCGAVFAVLIVELLNTGIESAIDRVGPQWHVFSKRAKDLGSAAVLLSLVFCALVWVSAIATRVSWGNQ